MNAARSAARRNWPRGLYEIRAGYYLWRHPDGRNFTLGAMPLPHAIHQAMQANAHVLATKPSLLDRLMGGTNTVAQLLEKMPHAENKNTAKSLRSLDKKITAAFGETACIAITTADCATVIEREAAEVGARSGQALRSRLSVVFKRAMGLGWVESNPAEATTNPRVQVVRGRLTLDTYRLIYEAAPQVNEWLQHAMRLAIITGQDRKTIAGMTRSMVSTIEGERVLIVQRSKTQATNKPVAIPLRLRLDALGMTLDEALAHRTGVVSPFYLHHVAPHSNAEPGDPVFLDRISKAFTDARKLACIPDEAAPTFHELRSLSKRLYEKQGNVDTRVLLGHASERAANLYADPRGVEALLVKIAV